MQGQDPKANQMLGIISECDEFMMRQSSIQSYSKSFDEQKKIKKNMTLINLDDERFLEKRVEEIVQLYYTHPFFKIKIDYIISNYKKQKIDEKKMKKIKKDTSKFSTLKLSEEKNNIKANLKIVQLMQKLGINQQI